MKALKGKEARKPASSEPAPSNGYQLIPLSKLHSNPNQPRQVWDKNDDEEGRTKLERLADSIKVEGVLQPLVVTSRNGGFLIVCGERRFRASKIAKLDKVPCLVRPNLDDKAILELSITENLQREDLTPIDEAKAVKLLISKCGYSQSQVGRKLGLSIAAVNYKLSLLKLSPEIQKDISKGKLSETQGRAIAQESAKVEPSKRIAAMASIKEKVDKARESKPTKKLSTKDVRSVAKTAAAQHVRVGASTSKGTPRPKLVPTKPPTPKEKAQAKKFGKTISKVEKAFLPFARIVLTKDIGERFAQILHTTAPKTAETVKSVHVFLGRMLEHINEAKRQSLARKIQ